MKKIFAAVLFVVVAAAGLAAMPGCAQNKAGSVRTGKDQVIQHYMQRRSDLLGQRRRLAATYGANSLQVAEVDRQIALVDQALTQRRNQLIDEENARRQVQQMKGEAAPLPGTAAGTQPSSRPAR